MHGEPGEVGVDNARAIALAVVPGPVGAAAIARVALAFVVAARAARETWVLGKARMAPAVTHQQRVEVDKRAVQHSGSDTDGIAEVVLHDGVRVEVRGTTHVAVDHVMGEGAAVQVRVEVCGEKATYRHVRRSRSALEPGACAGGAVGGIETLLRGAAARAGRSSAVEAGLIAVLHAVGA